MAVGIIDQINKLLDQSATEYKAGNFEDTRAHAREASLRTMKTSKGDIAADNMDLMKKIEVATRVDLMQMIDGRKPAQDVQAHMDQIKADLQTAKAAVTPSSRGRLLPRRLESLARLRMTDL